MKQSYPPEKPKQKVSIAAELTAAFWTGILLAVAGLLFWFRNVPNKKWPTQRRERLLAFLEELTTDRNLRVRTKAQI